MTDLSPTASGSDFCPFYARPAERCQAGGNGHLVAADPCPARCSTHDHDDCPTFLAKLLRSLRPHPFQGQRDLWAK